MKKLWEAIESNSNNKNVLIEFINTPACGAILNNVKLLLERERLGLSILLKRVNTYQDLLDNRQKISGTTERNIDEKIKKILNNLFGCINVYRACIFQNHNHMVRNYKELKLNTSSLNPYLNISVCGKNSTWDVMNSLYRRLNEPSMYNNILQHFHSPELKELFDERDLLIKVMIDSIRQRKKIMICEVMKRCLNRSNEDFHKKLISPRNINAKQFINRFNEDNKKPLENMIMKEGITNNPNFIMFVKIIFPYLLEGIYDQQSKIREALHKIQFDDNGIISNLAGIQMHRIGEDDVITFLGTGLKDDDPHVEIAVHKLYSNTNLSYYSTVTPLQLQQPPYRHTDYNTYTNDPYAAHSNTYLPYCNTVQQPPYRNTECTCNDSTYFPIYYLM